MKRIAALLLFIAATFPGLARAADLPYESGFAHPPADTRPWVYWFWSDGNITRAGITADLEAMQRVGIGGVLIMEVDQGVPPGPVRFMSPAWREMFAFAASEAARLGLSIDMNDDAGWNGSGGPWIDAAHSMQKVVWKETHVTGPRQFDGALDTPEATADFYRDIAVLAFPTPRVTKKIAQAEQKSGLGLAVSPDQVATGDPAATLDRGQIIDLTARCHDGRLAWDVPSGDWTLLRLGHTSTGRMNHPAPTEGRGLEIDKLSRSALDLQYDAFFRKLIGDGRTGGAPAVSTVHVDSWEIGYQNWTEGFRAAFQQRRGYDPLPWLPAFAGHIVGNLELSERFLWDVRRTISELLNDNYATRLAERAHADGRQFSLEGYSNGPFDCLSYTGRADLPVAEFWTTRDPLNLHASVKTMTSAGHIYGRKVIAAEAFTATDANGRQRNHPFTLKAIGDAAFCSGVNHFIFHRYSLQPWTDDRKPGMTMGPWGVEYERTATWWEQTKPWHEYLARCQYLLRQGLFVADLCYLQSEEGINNPTPPAHVKPAVPAGYDFDFCSDEVVRTRMMVRDGRLTLPDGMSYRVLVLPSQRLMTPPLLRKIRELVRAGAIVFGAPPRRSPSLSGYPECDTDVKQIVAELWNEAPSDLAQPLPAHKVIWGPKLEDVLIKLRIEPDFAWRNAEAHPAAHPPVRYIHRTLPDREVYFVANLGDAPTSIVASFRGAEHQPELWRADSGTMTPAAVYDAADRRVRVPLDLDARGSLFVVFKHDQPPRGDHLLAVKKDGRAIWETNPVDLTPRSSSKPFTDVTDTFTYAAWVKPSADTTLPREAITGTGAYSVPRNDLLYPPPGHEVFDNLEAAGAGLAVGRNGVTVLEHGDHHFVATLVQPTAIADWTHVAVVFEHGKPTLYLNGERTRTGLKSRMTLHAGVGVPHTREIPTFTGQHSALQQFDRALSAVEIRELMRKTPKTPITRARAETASAVASTPSPLELAGQEVWPTETGRYEFVFANHTTHSLNVAKVTAPRTVDGPWTVRFPTGWGAPPEVELPALISWPEHQDPGVRYFSGTATYVKAIEVPSDAISRDRRVWLDLGDVQVIAEVKLNGHDVGTLWKPPFRTEVTGVLHPGQNTLEVRVTNLWVNRLIGDEQLPPDREWVKLPRRNGFVLKAYPDWLQRGERSPTGRITFATWKHYEKDAPLLPSGLLGPVTLQTEEGIALPLAKEQP